MDLDYITSRTGVMVKYFEGLDPTFWGNELKRAIQWRDLVFAASLDPAEVNNLLKSVAEILGTGTGGVELDYLIKAWAKLVLAKPESKS